jgi:hypothetical protein
VSITHRDVWDVKVLSSSLQKCCLQEAIWKIIHAIAADNGAKTIVVCSPDTDVLVLLLHHWPAIKADKIYFPTGCIRKQTQLSCCVPVHTIHGMK